MSNDTKTKAYPSHRIYAVTKYGKNQEKRYWRTIGALWPHADGKGFHQQLDYLPLIEAEIVVREFDEDKDHVEEPVDHIEASLA